MILALNHPRAVPCLAAHERSFVSGQHLPTSVIKEVEYYIIHATPTTITARLVLVEIGSLSNTRYAPLRLQRLQAVLWFNHQLSQPTSTSTSTNTPHHTHSPAPASPVLSKDSAS